MMQPSEGVLSRPSFVLFCLEGIRAEWLRDVQRPIVEHRYEVSMAVIRGEHTLGELDALSRVELGAVLHDATK